MPGPVTEERCQKVGLVLLVAQAKRATHFAEYLLAFGPSRHRAWVLGMGVRGRSLGFRARPVGRHLEVVLRRSQV